jgi:hypothetical protein
MPERNALVPYRTEFAMQLRPFDVLSSVVEIGLFVGAAVVTALGVAGLR